jgi:hypothetical protein
LFEKPLEDVHGISRQSAHSHHKDITEALPGLVGAPRFETPKCTHRKELTTCMFRPARDLHHGTFLDSPARMETYAK